MARFGRIALEGDALFVEVEGERLHVLSRAPWEGVSRTGQVVPAAEASWLVPTPASKVVAIGQNYRAHAAEMGKKVPEEPLLFLKPSTALNAHLSPIVLPPASQDVQHEAEVALVIGQRLSKVDEATAARGIFALSCFNDVTARDVQRRETQHTRAKSYDTFACLGPWMVTGLDWRDLRIQCRLNGATRQDGRTSDMVHAPPKLVSFISQVMTLLPGDVVITGTPAGVGPMAAGDVVEVEVEGVGVLKNPVTR
ncbi:MAG: fumarylacetoacetate hydrolase family protein [Myxococcales bacterium]|nr:fumarylacetoacetate hydrolase family protein [Myxococcales bacterium]